MSLFSRLKKKYDLTPSERHLVDFIMINSNDVMEMSMTELAKATFISRSTIARFCEKNGFNGYHDFKTQLAIEMNLFLKENASGLIFPIEAQDKPRDIIDRMTSNSIYSLMETSKANKPEILEEIVNKLKTARNLMFFGTNFSHMAAQDASLRFLQSGLPVVSYATPDEMVVQAQFARKEDAVLLLSYSGQSKKLLKIAEILKKRGATCISITANSNNPLAEISDYNLYINATDAISDIFATSSRIAMLNVIDILYMMYVHSDIDCHLKLLNSVETDW